MRRLLSTAPTRNGCAITLCLLCHLTRAAFAEGHHFACADYVQGKVFIVAADGQVEWEHPAPNCNELWMLPNGNLLFTTGHGVAGVRRCGAGVGGH